MYYAPPEEKHPEQRAFSKVLYVIAAFGAIAQYAESVGMVIAGCIILGISGFMVKAQRMTAQGTIYASHVEWISRTLTIGSRYLFPLSLVVALWCVYTMTDIEGLKKVLAEQNSDDLGKLSGLVKGYIEQNEQKINMITTWSITPPIFWWVRRCWVGLMKAEKSEPIDYPDSLF